MVVYTPGVAGPELAGGDWGPGICIPGYQFEPERARRRTGDEFIFFFIITLVLLGVVRDVLRIGYKTNYETLFLSFELFVRLSMRKIVRDFQ